MPVRATTDHSSSSYGRAVWVDEMNNAYCEVDTPQVIMDTLPYEVLPDVSEIKRILGDRVRIAREAKGWTRERLARELILLTGKTVRGSNIADVEEARKAYTIDLLANIYILLEDTFPENPLM